MTRPGDPELQRRLGQRVNSLRVGRGVSSQEELGGMAQVHRTYVGRLERGEVNPTMSSLARIAAALGVTLSELVRGVEAEGDSSEDEET